MEPLHRNQWIEPSRLGTAGETPQAFSGSIRIETADADNGVVC